MRFSTVAAVTCGILAASRTAVSAQETTTMATQVTIPQTQVFDLHSERADADFQIWVAEPVPISSRACSGGSA